MNEPTDTQPPRGGSAALDPPYLLTYTAGTQTWGQGGSVVNLNAGGTGYNGGFTRDLNNDTSTNQPGERWVAAMFNVQTTATGNWSHVEFSLTSNGGNRAVSFGITDNRIMVAAGGAVAGSPTLSGVDDPIVAIDTTYFLLGRLRVIQTDGNADGPEHFDLWINPTDLSSVDALGAPDHTIDANIIFGPWSMSSVSIRGGSNTSTSTGNRVDEIMVGTTLDDIVSFSTFVIPEPTSLALLTLGSLALIARRSRRGERA